MALDDPLLEEAKQMVIKTGKASASFFQRRFRIGYARAASLLDMLEQLDIVGPADGSKPREVLVKNSRPDILEDNGSLGELDDAVKDIDIDDIPIPQKKKDDAEEAVEEEPQTEEEDDAEEESEEEEEPENNNDEETDEEEKSKNEEEVDF